MKDQHINYGTEQKTPTQHMHNAAGILKKEERTKQKKSKTKQNNTTQKQTRQKKEGTSNPPLTETKQKQNETTKRLRRQKKKGKNNAAQVKQHKTHRNNKGTT